MSAKHDKETDKQTKQQIQQSDAAPPTKGDVKAEVKPKSEANHGRQHQHKSADSVDAKAAATKPATGGTTVTQKTQARPADADLTITTVSRVTFWVVVLLGMLMLASAAAALYWLWLEQKKTAQQIAEVSGQIIQSSTAEHQLQDNLTGLESRIARLELDLQQQKVMQDELSRRFSQSNDPVWLLDEAEYLVRIANHRLQLEHDIPSAISALQLADQRLLQLAHPRAQPIRQLLSNEIIRLQAVALPDIAGIAMTLTSLQQQVELLPLSGALPVTGRLQEQASNQPVTKDWRQFIADVWLNLKQLVTVRRIDEQSVAIIAPEQRYFLRQNLALQLAGARYAMLRSDDAVFQQSLSQLQQWLQRYFDPQDAAVIAFNQSLLSLEKITLRQDLPPVSNALTALQRLQKEGLTAPIKTLPVDKAGSGKVDSQSAPVHEEVTGSEQDETSTTPATARP